MKEFMLNGTIVPNDEAWIYSFFGIEHTTPEAVKDFLDDAAGEDVIVTITSGGGDLYSGVNIYDMLRAYAGTVETRVSGIAASAASIVAMAGKTMMSPGSVLMIHNASCLDRGDKNEKISVAKNVLSVHDKAIANVYAQKTGLDTETIQKMMDKETWLDAAAAIENGFADGMLDETNSPLRMAASLDSGLISPSAITKIKELMKLKDQKNEKNEPEDGVPVDQLKKRLNLLRR